MRFIGRGNTPAGPQAVQASTESLSGSRGSGLVPVAAIRCPIRIAPGETATVSYRYGVADTREACPTLVKKYQEPGKVDAVFDDAARMHQRTLDKLGMTRAQADTYSRLADSIIYNNARCRAASSVIEARSEEHTSELQSLMSISYAVFFLKKKKQQNR